MSTPVVVLTRSIPEIGITMLQSECEVVIHSKLVVEDGLPLSERIVDADALLCLLTDPIRVELIDAGHKLKIISNYAVGYDNIDIEHATSRGIVVTNTPGVLTIATAELAWTLIFAVCRQIVAADKFVRDGHFQGWDPLLFLGHEVTGKTLGIIGMGRIGQAVAGMAAGFDMTLLYYDPHHPELAPGLSARAVSLDELAQRADIISVHVPLTDQTHHLCDKVFFTRCKQNAIFINTARGPIVHEQALFEALDQGKLAGAGLDVYEYEPEIYGPLVSKTNVVLAPHMGSATLQARDNMARLAAQNIIDLLQGKKPRFVINHEVFTRDK